jgi:hypothetical protein
MVEEISEMSAARTSFLEAQRTFEETIEKLSIPKIPENFFTPFVRAFRAALGSTAISWEVAANGYIASHDALSKLADAATTSSELRRYTNCMKAVTQEYSAVVDRILVNNGGVYEKLTDALKTAAGDLKAALQKAKDTAASLNLVADIVGAFSKLIPIL